MPAAIRTTDRRDIGKGLSGDVRMVEAVVSHLDGSPVGERRRWSDAFKERAVAASFEPAVNISELARRLEIRPSLLYDWCKAFLRQQQCRANLKQIKPSAREVVTSMVPVEVVIGDATIRVGSEIGEAALARILRAVRAT